MKKSVVLLVAFLLCIAQGKSQGIGNYSGLDGGFENQPTSGNASSLSLPASGQSFFTVGSNTTVTFQNTGGYSGAKYIQVSTSSSSAAFYSPTFNLAANTQYVVQYYYQYSSSSNRGFNVSASPNGGANFGTASTAVNVSGVTGWTKRTEIITSANYSANGNGILKFSSNGGGSLSGFYIDDIVIYPGSTVDNTAAYTATNVTATARANAAVISWNAASVDAQHDLSGYLVVRSTDNNTTQPIPVPATNGIYLAGNNLDANTQIVYEGTGTSFVDNAVSNGTQYTYIVYSVDQAFNYSSAQPVTITPGSNTTTTSSNPGAFSTFSSTDNTTLAGLTGNVAIGTAIDSTSKLKVGGNILATGNIAANGLILGGTAFNPSIFHTRSVGAIGGTGNLNWNNATGNGTYDISIPSSGTFTNQPHDSSAGILLNFNNSSSALQLFASAATGALYFKTGLTDSTGKLSNYNWKTLFSGSSSNQYLALSGGSLTGGLTINDGAMIINSGEDNYYRAGDYVTIGNTDYGNSPYISFNAILTTSDENSVPHVNLFTPKFCGAPVNIPGYPASGLIIKGDAGQSGLHFLQYNYSNGTDSNYSPVNMNAFKEVVTLTNAGMVGIGTTNPTEMLAVNGNILTKKVRVTQNGWPDYVFDSAYRLQPLEKLETFIKNNKHLPDVPAAAEMSKEGGLDLGDNQAVLMRKIEELTLYMISQQKQLEELKLQNEKTRKVNEEMQKKIELLEKK